MSLTIGSIAPLGRPTGGALNIALPATPAHLLYLHRVPQRVRGRVDGVDVVDTVGARMLHETALLPRWYVPREDVATDRLEPSPTVTHCPFKGDARYWHLRVGDHLIEDAFWEYPVAVDDAAPDLSGLLSPYLDRWGTWLEEDEEVVGHPRDPFHRVDALASSRPVTVRIDGEVVASSGRAVAVVETGLPVRWYLPAADVQVPRAASETTSVCPYKGRASYWTLTTASGEHPDLAWSYEEPLGPAATIAGLVSFDGDGVDVEVASG